MEWAIEQIRADEAAARAFFPLGDTRLSKRLGLIKADTAAVVGRRRQDYPAQLCSKIQGGNQVESEAEHH